MATLPSSSSNLIPIKVTQLGDAPVASGDGLLLYIYEGNTYKIRAGDLLQVSGVPITRNVLAGTALTGGGPLSADVTLSVAPGGIGTTQLAPSGVSAGQYGSASAVPVVTVDATGRVTTISTEAIPATGVPTSRQVIAGAGLTGGGALNADVTLAAGFSDVAALSVDTTGAAGVATTLSRADHRHPAVDLADDNQVDGLLGLDNGGTARSLVPVPGAIVWSGADGLYIGTAGINGQVLVSGGSGAYAWGSALVVTDQAANVVYAGPDSGPAGPTTFRALVPADVPTLNQDTTGKAATADALSTATTHVSTAAASAPTAGQVLTASSGSTAVWGGISGGTF